MSQQIVASRYAKSLIGLAQEKGVLDTVYKDMVLFDEVVNASRELQLVFASPIISHFKKLEIIRGIFQKKVDPATFTIFEIITRKNREEILPALAEEFKNQYAVIKGIQKATVSSVVPLTEMQRQSFIKVVADATGKTIDLVEKIEPNLIGGYVLRVGDRQVDTSVRKKLNDLKVSMLS